MASKRDMRLGGKVEGGVKWVGADRRSGKSGTQMK